MRVLQEGISFEAIFGGNLNVDPRWKTMEWPPNTQCPPSAHPSNRPTPFPASTLTQPLQKEPQPLEEGGLPS